MDLVLKISQGTNAGQEVTISCQTFLIVRAEDCHLRPGSEMISRHHCAIVVDQAYVAIRDFGSKNGTFVNSQRVFGERELKSGDQLRVGPLEFEIFLRQGELGGRKKPPVQNARQAAERTAAGQPDDLDVARFLDNPGGELPSARSLQPMAAVDTQSIQLTETEQIAITQPPAAPAAEPTAPPATARPTTAPKLAPPSTFQMPQFEAPAPVAEEASSRLEKKKVYGKLPVQPQRPENTRSAAADALDKLRKRR
jgi:pSer/pThr/pTyr-binding forkhead associated (FHA) protein